jgi:ABC-type phosphate transport system substrate-binding protein
MKSLRRFLTISAILALSGTGAAYAQGVTPGNYEFAYAHAAPCSATLAADGSATVDPACKASFSHWRATLGGIELLNGAGDVYATLNTKGDTYAGVVFSNNHTIVLTPASQTAGLVH